jgi:hypothetical protein
MRARLAVVTLTAVALAGCQTSSQVGMIARSAADPAAVVRNAVPYRELGPAKGRSCRYFLLAIIPWGDGTVAAALDDALQPVNGDALTNVLVSSSLYTFIPYFNVFSFGCTSLEGLAIAFQPAGDVAPTTASPPPTDDPAPSTPSPG